MAKFPEEVNFTPASADASATYPVQCGSLRKGGMVVLKVLTNTESVNYNRIYYVVCAVQWRSYTWADLKA